LFVRYGIYLNFFKFVGIVLPFKYCRINYEKHKNKYPLNDIVLLNKENLVKWLIDIHNEVNIMNGKKVLSYNEVINIYFGNSNKKIYKLSKKSMVLLFIFIVIIILCLVLKTYSK
jgi:hypothetical protein